MWRALPLVLLLACGNKNQPKPTEEAATEEDGGADATEGTETEGEDGATEGEEGEGTDAGSQANAEKPTPESLYAECKDRMELPQKEGECTKDEDCATGGCGSEVCSTPDGLKDLMFTCVDKPCFHVGDTCGCHEGQCTWTLKEELPEMNKLPPAPLPPNRLPPTPPPTDDGAEKDGGEAPPAEEKAEEGAE